MLVELVGVVSSGVRTTRGVAGVRRKSQNANGLHGCAVCNQEE